MLGNTVEPLALQCGQVRKQHYAYEKFGSCALLAAIEPLTGQRLAHVQPRRTKREFAHFCQALASAYPQAQQIRLVLDNLNTHNTSAFYEALPADEAFALAQRFVFVYTPKAASWLNMLELEFSALARLCLNRRIPTLAKLEAEILALVAEREHKGIKLHWQFSIQSARTKFNSQYQRLHAANDKFVKT